MEEIMSNRIRTVRELRKVCRDPKCSRVVVEFSMRTAGGLLGIGAQVKGPYKRHILNVVRGQPGTDKIKGFSIHHHGLRGEPYWLYLTVGEQA